MLNERYFWSVCVEEGDDWENIGSHETRREAEAELQRVRTASPEAFLMRITMTRMDQARATAPLTTV